VIYQILRTNQGLYPDAQLKARFHYLGRQVLSSIGCALKDRYAVNFTVSSCEAGIAVLGEVTLHMEDLYVQLCPGCWPGDIMYRSCKGLEDYTGGCNQWLPRTQLLDLPGLINKLHEERAKKEEKAHA